MNVHINVLPPFSDRTPVERHIALELAQLLGGGAEHKTHPLWEAHPCILILPRGPVQPWVM